MQKMTLRKRRRINLIILGIVVLVLASVSIGFGFKDNIEYYKSPTAIKEEGAPDRRFRIGGLVLEGSLKLEGEHVEFVVTDGTTEQKVSYEGLLPDGFGEGQGVIARGVIEGAYFQSDQIMAKHDENYMPKEVVDILKEEGVYKE